MQLSQGGCPGQYPQQQQTIRGLEGDRGGADRLEQHSPYLQAPQQDPQRGSPPEGILPGQPPDPESGSGSQQHESYGGKGLDHSF